MSEYSVGPPPPQWTPPGPPPAWQQSVPPPPSRLPSLADRLLSAARWWLRIVLQVGGVALAVLTIASLLGATSFDFAGYRLLFPRIDPPINKQCIVPKEETGVGVGPIEYTDVVIPDKCDAIIDSEYVLGLDYHGVFLVKEGPDRVALTLTSGGITIVDKAYARDSFCEIVRFAINHAHAISYVKGLSDWGADPCDLGHVFPPYSSSPSP